MFKCRDIKPNTLLFVAAMLTEVDRSVGMVVQSLSERGILNNSIIIFTTDNGGSAGGFENSAASNWPLRGVKDSVGLAFIYTLL
jgi:arylsulfatase A-like enzyme